MKDKIAYHLVTNNKMELNTEIIFSNDSANSLSNFFFGKVFRNSDGEDYFDILNKCTNDNNLIISNENLNTVFKYSDITAKGIRELITEYIRLKEFSTMPSRLSCLYVAESLDSALEWKKIFDCNNRKTLQLVMVAYSGKSFVGDANKLPKNNGISFYEKMNEARNYWQSTTLQKLPEMLIDGTIKVVDIIAEYA